MRYSSACACLGVTASTVTLATPVATSTSSITETHSVTETVTASTESITSTVTTTTETTTDATTTLTTLVTSTTTLAASSTPVPTWFYIQAVGGTSDGWLLGSPMSTSSLPFTFSKNAGSQVAFTLVNGKLFDGSGYPIYYTYYPQNTYTSSVQIMSVGSTSLPASQANWHQVSCSLRDDSTLDCSDNYPFNQGYGICGGTLRFFRVANITNTATWCSGSSTISTIMKAVPATPQFIKVKAVGGSHDGEWMYIDTATQQIRFGPWTSITPSIFTFAMQPLWPTFNAADNALYTGSTRISMTFGLDWSYVYYGASPAGVPLPDGGNYWIPTRLWVTETAAPYSLVGQPGLMQGRTSIATCGDRLVIYKDGTDPAAYCSGAEKIRLEAIPAVIPWAR